MMSFKNINRVIVGLVVLMLLAPIKAEATVPVSSGYISPEETVLIAMHYEDASNVGHIKAQLEQNLVAFEYAFAKLQSEGKLDPNFPRLVIVAYKFYYVDYRFEIAPTVISLTDSATLVCAHPGSPQFDPRELGPAYVINTAIALTSYGDIVAMMLKLRDLNDTTPSIKINEEELSMLKTHPEFERFMNFEVKGDKSDIISGGLKISSRWKSATTHFSLTDEAGKLILDLKPADIYLGIPSWPPVERKELQGRILAYASSEQAFIYDINKEKYHILNLDFKFKDVRFKGMENIPIQMVSFAMYADEDKVYVLPWLNMGWINILYELDLNTGEWLRVMEGEGVFDKWLGKTNSGLWLNFVSAFPDRSLMNIDILTKDWTDRQNVPVAGNVVSEEEPQPDKPAVLEEKPPQVEPIGAEEEPIQETEAEGVSLYKTFPFWLILPVAAAAAVFIYIKRKPNFLK